ncbi:MAG: class I SAM-dependent methyltransferase, partial [Verrucomicrobiota bacterium]|nr:class I SAM-dependent methyltransferase [Verrucomicrobiota bacterium]
FKDHFSGHAAEYARYRPHYPAAMFEYLSSLAPNHECAWDCATGNGQAAVALAPFFERVLASDASAKQIENAQRHERVEYRVATAGASELGAESIALITVAQALHWFDREKFFAESNRVLQRNGLLAVWSYNLFQVAPEIDRLVETFYRETVGPFWDFERKLVETGYRTIEFPFAEIAPPEFQMSAHWSLEQALGYLRTWSATKGFIAARGFDPVDSLGEQLRKLWPANLRVDWPLSLIVRRKD